MTRPLAYLVRNFQHGLWASITRNHFQWLSRPSLSRPSQIFKEGKRERESEREIINKINNGLRTNECAQSPGFTKSQHNGACRV